MSRKRTKATKHLCHPAKMPDGQIRYYDSPEKAEGARRSAWAAKTAARNRIEVAAPDARFDFCTASEQRFIEWASDRGINLHRNGWPDFIGRSPSGGLAAIEVKSGRTDPLRPEQIACASLLEEAGIKVFVWTRATGLVHWKEHAKDRPAVERGCSSGQTSRNRNGKNDRQKAQDPVDATLAAEDRTPSVLTPSGSAIH